MHLLCRFEVILNKQDQKSTKCDISKPDETNTVKPDTAKPDVAWPDVA